MKYTFVVLLICALTACTKEPAYFHVKGAAQGTTFSIKYQGIGAEDYSDEIAHILTDFDNSLSLWREDSFLSRLNADRDSIVQIPHEDVYFEPVFKSSMQIRHETKGAFDPSVYPLVRAWGFGAIPPDSDSIPEVEAIMKAHHIGNYQANIAEMGPDKAIMRPTGLEFDFNGIAQGYSVDVVADLLASKGIKDYLVEIGGELKAHGLRPDSTLWTIGLDRPHDGPRELMDTLLVNNEAMATSGSYRKYHERNGKRYSHCIDPRSGYPADHTLLSVTVVAPTCMEADGYATAFLVMGVKETLALLKGGLGKKLDVLMIYDDQGTDKIVGTGRFEK